MAKKNTRLAGHALPNEGRVGSTLDSSVLRNGPGRSRCTCGKRSPLLPSTAQRKRWHRDHKEAARK
jgi:hypothetical protein